MPNHHSALRRMPVVATAILLVFSACSGDENGGETSSTTSNTAAQTTMNSSSAPPTPSATASTTTTVGQPREIGEAVLVVADDGVYQIGTEGDVTLLLAGRVTYAVDDTQGGLLFQVDRGRTGDQQAARSTIVWWIPRGTSTPQELLVPTPGVGHRLSLHDAYATDDGFAVLYTRHEGVTTDEMTDRLRRFDVPARQVTELYSQGAFEQGYGHVSTNGELIAGVWFQQIGSGCFIYDLNGQPTDLVPEEASDPTSEDHVAGCRLSPGSDRLSFVTEQYEDNQHVSTTLHVWDLNADAETTRFVVPGSAGIPSGLDVSATKAIATIADENQQQALVFDLGDPETDPVPLPIAGRARFVATPIDIAVPVRSPGFVAGGPDHYRYGDDGLFRVVDGIETQLTDGPVERVWDDRMGGVITADVTAIDILHLPAGEMMPIPLFRQSRDDYAYAYARFTGVLDGYPSLFFAGIPEGADLDEWPCVDWALNSRDLVTGKERQHLCLPIEDAGFDIRSVGGGLFVGAPYGLCGGTGSSSSIEFWDTAGNPVEVPTNPYPPTQSCAPCELDALISPDGTELLYRHRPDSFNHDSPYYSGPPCGGGAEQVEAWWKGSRAVAAEIVVLDLDSGEELWRLEVPADFHLSDFDGRFLVVAREGESVIYDTWGVHEPVEVAGGVALIRQSMADATGITLRPDGLGVASLGEPADDVLNTLASLLGQPNTDYFVDPVAAQTAMPYGFAANRYFRLASWDEIGLYIVMSDSNYFRDDGQPHFVGWSVTRPSLQTEAWIGVGATAAELVAAYGDAVALPDSFLSGCDQGWSLRVGSPIVPDSSDYIDLMHGELSGDPADPLSRVLRLSGGAAASC